MIQWQITTERVITGATYFSSSSSASSTNANNINRSFGAGGSSVASGTSFGSTSYTEVRSTSIGLDGTTVFSSSSSTEESASASGVTIDDGQGATATPSYPPFTTAGSASYSDSGSSLFEEISPMGTAEVETSTTRSVMQAFFQPVLTVENNETFYTVQSATAAYTYPATTIIGQTQQTNGLSATVVQAEPGEVLYFIANPAQNWNGFDPATNAAQSGTRFTITPSYSTSLIQIINAAVSTSSSLLNAAVTNQLFWKRLTQTIRTQTGVAYSRLPNSTFTFSQLIATTTQSSSSYNVFDEDTVFFGRTDNQTSSSRTTSEVVSHVIILTTYAGGQYGNVTHQDVRLTTSSKSVKVSAVAYGTASQSSRTTASLNDTGQQDVTLTGSSETQSASTYSVQGNTIVYGPAQITTGGGFPVSRSKFATTGVVLNGQTGLWFSANAQHTVSDIAGLTLTLIVGHGSGRRGAVLFPQTNSLRTIDQNSLTYSTTTTRSTDSVNSATSQNTTSSMELSLFGQSYTVVDNLTSNRPRHHGGGPIGKGCTAVDVFGAGCYKDQVSGATSSTWGKADVLTEGESAPIRSWFPINHIAPPVLRYERNGILWSAVRNVSTTWS